VDGVVFVADSSESKMEENLESLENLKNNLAEYGKDIRELPVVLQYNKRDLPDALPVEALNQKLNPWGAPYFEAVAITGEGVFPTLKCLSGMVLETLNRDHRSAAAPAGKISVTSDGVAAPVPVAAAAAVAAPVPVAAAAAASPPRPQLRTGASAMDQVPPPAPAASRPQARPAAGTAQVRPGAGSAQIRPGGSIQQGNVPGRVTQNRMRKVEATPLQQTIRTTPASSTGSHRMVKLPPERKFPWLVVGLVILTVGAAAAVLGSLGFLTGSGE
jgi:hypothetical protein